jgi:F0F1-type ATP synthase epsilon subunit
MIAQPTLQVMVMTPQQVLFEGEAVSVSSINDTGPFDVLGDHANFITLIKDQLIIRMAKDEYRTIISDGLLRVFQGDVKIFLGLQINSLSKQSTTS